MQITKNPLRSKIASVILGLLFLANLTSRAEVSLSYYLPESGKYDTKIPTPKSVLGYEVGEWHASHDQIVSYARAIAAVSPRVKLVEYGRTHENRPLLVLIVTSEENQKNLETIKEQHLQVSDPEKSKNVNIDNLPVFTWLGNSIHGNEASGANASLLVLYHLAAANDAETLKLLSESVIFIDPAINPDGINRFASWVNSHKSKVENGDPSNLEHQEAWPGGRTNHYWFDLNRDWLNVQQPESQGRITKLQEWRPNIYTDAHEQGTNATFHFSPGAASRVHPLIPAEDQRLTLAMAQNFYAKAFDKIGSLYFTGETYDDYNIGRGPEYLDFNGGVAFLFEQASARGFAQTSDNGLLTFPFAVRNQVTAELATIKGAHALKKNLVEYQRWYFTSALQEAAKDPVKAYVFGSKRDRASVYHLAEIISRHGIDVFKLKKKTEFQGSKFEADNSIIVPLSQKQYRLIQGIFEIRNIFKDSITYDISAWTYPLAFNLEYKGLDAGAYNTGLLGDKYSRDEFPKGKWIGTQQAYAYAFEWSEYYAPRALNRLLEKGILAKVSSAVFKSGSKEFKRGTILIPTGNNQPATIEQIQTVLKEITEKDAIDVYSLEGGFTDDHQLGSSTFERVDKPEVAILSGGRLASDGIGAIWHLLDTRYQIGITLIPIESFNAAKLGKYNSLILDNGDYSLISEPGIKKLKTFVEEGNTLIAFEQALSFLNSKEFLKLEFVNSKAKNADATYENQQIIARAQSIPGTIFETTVDITHPLFWGLTNKHLPVFKDNNVIVKPQENPYANPSHYSSKPLLSGLVNATKENDLKNNANVTIGFLGRGHIIAINEDTNFRGQFYGTNKILANAIFFGSLIRSGANAYAGY